MNFITVTVPTPLPSTERIEAPSAVFPGPVHFKQCPSDLALSHPEYISSTANAPCNHILTLESHEGIFLLIAACGSPFYPGLVLYPNPITPSAQPIPGVKWNVLLSKKKTFTDVVFSGLESVGVGPACLGVNMGYEIPERIWQRTPMTFLSSSISCLPWLTRECAFKYQWQGWYFYLTEESHPCALLMPLWSDHEDVRDVLNLPPRAQTWLPKCSDEWHWGCSWKCKRGGQRWCVTSANPLPAPFQIKVYEKKH